MKRKVALFTRAWIEMLSIICCEVVTPVALFTRAWIEIYLLKIGVKTTKSRPLYEGVD